jgi:5'-phosphate synthase pdxT subunit
VSVPWMKKNCWLTEDGNPPMKIGVLALQGAFIEHIHVLKKIGVKTLEVRLPEDLAKIDGLIIPGGESTTMVKLANMYGFMNPLREFAEKKAVWGTCAGMIVMAKEVKNEKPALALMDIVVERNAFGRQVDSFEQPLFVPKLDKGEEQPFPAVFIRAPKLIEARNNAEIIAELSDGTAVGALENNLLVTAFHPELSNDDRFHRFFLDLVAV